MPHYNFPALGNCFLAFRALSPFPLTLPLFPNFSLWTFFLYPSFLFPYCRSCSLCRLDFLICLLFLGLWQNLPGSFDIYSNLLQFFFMNMLFLLLDVFIFLTATLQMSTIFFAISKSFVTLCFEHYIFNKNLLKVRNYVKFCEIKNG